MVVLLKFEPVKFFFLDTLDASPVFRGFSFEQLTLYDMLVSLEEGQAASPGVSIEEVARSLKKQKVGIKGKEKVGSSVWSNAEAAMDYANELLTPGEMKEISSIPSHEMVSCHVHKLVLVILLIFVHFFFLFILNQLVDSW